MTTLDQIFDKYGRPDPSMVSQLPKKSQGGTVYLDYVGHAEITRILSEVDPTWTWEPAGWDNGRPAIHVHQGEIHRRDAAPIEVPTATLWGYLTLLGVRRLAVGSVEAHKPDLDKELVSDFLRNAAMRFGIALALWMKEDNSTPSAPRSATMVTEQRGETTVSRPSNAPTEKQLGFLRKMLKEAGQLPPANLASLDKWEVSKLIDALKNADEVPPPNDQDFEPEEPF